MSEIVIVFLLGFLVFREIISFIERDRLTKKLMARDFVEYASFEAAQHKKEAKVEKKIAL